MKNYFALFCLILPYFNNVSFCHGIVTPAPLNCAVPGEVSFGVSQIEEVPNWDETLCPYPANHTTFNPTGNNVVLSSLVTIDYGYAPNHDLNWWIESWAFGSPSSDGYQCSDDSNLSDDCISAATEDQGGCSTEITIQVVGECDRCVNRRLGGTWFKGSKVIDPVFYGIPCWSSRDNLIPLFLQPRTDCFNEREEWGCEPHESN